MASLLLDPVTLIFLFLVSLTWYTYRRGDKKITIVSISISSIYLLLASPLLANSLTLLLEGREKPIACESINPSAIVVLGGGVNSSVRTIEDIDYLHVASFRRIQSALRLAQEHPELKIFVSGGAGNINVTESDLMSAMLQRQGINSKRIIKERKSLNTWESSSNTGLILKGKNIKSIYLVTSALHMPRAIRGYRKQGLDVCAYPTDRMFIRPKWYAMLIPQMSALIKTKNALHEIAGIIWYYLTGKI